METEAH